MLFPRTQLKEEIVVHNLISLHYFECAKDLLFQGERHDFWEFLYVDSGEVEVMADTLGYKLKQGNIIFHKPNEFHSVWANKKVAPNLIVITFECDSAPMHFFENKIYSLGDSERNILANIVKQGFDAFDPPLDNPKINLLQRKENAAFGTEQLIKIHLELLLITMIKKRHLLQDENRLSTRIKQQSENDIVLRTINYMNENICEDLTFEQICNYLNVSKTLLIKMFKEKTDVSVMKYFKSLKVGHAKMMIREGKHNFTEISQLMKYTGIHCFSRHFKHVTETTPSQYAKSVKAKMTW